MEFENLFREAKGQPILYNGKQLLMVDRLSLSANKVKVRVSFVSTDSKWKQGIVLAAKGTFEVNNQAFVDKIVLWEDTAPKEVQLSIISEDRILNVYNAWRTENGTVHYWHNGAAMRVESLETARMYHCNDGYPDDDLNDLVFKIELDNVNDNPLD